MGRDGTQRGVRRLIAPEVMGDRTTRVEARRDIALLTATEALLEEQRETNRLLRELLAQRA